MAVMNDEVLFIHIPKTGGWSCKNWLKANVPGIKMPDEHENPFPIGHIPLRDIERFSGRKPGDFEKIVAVVRDPYAQQLSQWQFWRDRYARGGRHPHDLIAAMYPSLMHWLLDPNSDFHVWYEETIGDRTKTTAKKLGYQDFGGFYPYWLANEDNTFPDNLELVRFEQLEAFPGMFADYVEGEPGEMKHLNPGPKTGDTKEYYNAVAVQIVERKFRWAFESGLYTSWAKAA